MPNARIAGKIKTREEVAALIGARPRAAKVAMVHGCFQVVHAGHITHLVYTRGKADVLVASVTADRHIDKGVYSPHVPQDLRAMGLAALEVVDYVVIDDNATPLEIIGILQPDFYSKGFEYAGGNVKETQAESEVVRGYGGDLIFTPGDVVYSSSRLIEQSRPRLKREKLQAVMKRDGLTFEALYQALGAMKGKRVHVVGDIIVDSLTEAVATGGISKTPTLSVVVEGVRHFLGGAGVVAKHLKAAGAEVVITSVVGDDEMGRFAAAQLSGIPGQLIVDGTRPTTHKNAIVAAGYRLLKIDTVDNRTISDPVLLDLCRQIIETPADAVVFSDFRHGIFNRRTIHALVDSIRAPFRAADSQVASRWGNIAEFQEFDLITPNEREARFALGDQDSGIQQLAANLFRESKCRNLIMKLGERGSMTCRGAPEAQESFLALDTFAGAVVDPVGAGDALLAYSVLAMLATGSAAVAAILGGVAAALECERDGNVPITPGDVIDRLDDIEKEAAYGFGN